MPLVALWLIPKFSLSVTNGLLFCVKRETGRCRKRATGASPQEGKLLHLRTGKNVRKPRGSVLLDVPLWNVFGTSLARIGRWRGELVYELRAKNRGECLTIILRTL